MKLPSKSVQVVRLLAGNSSISLAGSEEQIIFFQQSPKMLKIVSKNFSHALLLSLGLFLKISRWVPLYILSNYQRDSNKVLEGIK